MRGPERRSTGRRRLPTPPRPPAPIKGQPMLALIVPVRRQGKPRPRGPPTEEGVAMLMNALDHGKARATAHQAAVHPRSPPRLAHRRWGALAGAIDPEPRMDDISSPKTCCARRTGRIHSQAALHHARRQMEAKTTSSSSACGFHPQTGPNRAPNRVQRLRQSRSKRPRYRFVLLDADDLLASPRARPCSPCCTQSPGLRMGLESRPIGLPMR